MLSLAAATTLWVAGQLPFSTQVSLPSGEKVALEADRLDYDAAHQVLALRGHAILRKGPLLLRADELDFDQVHERATAKGDVMLVEDLFAATADEIDAQVGVPEAFEASVKGLVAQQKQGVTAEQLLAAKTPAELRKLGRSILTMSGTHLKRKGRDEFVVDNLSFTPCDCSPTEPSWAIKAKRADVEMGERAILYWPVVDVHDIPIMAFPWLYLPLSDRRSGLLVPRPMHSSQNGWTIDQPAFITLGRSYDLTITPGYYFGANPVTNAFGVKGPRLVGELNYAPNEGTLGRITFGAIDDLRAPRDPVNPCPVDPATNGCVQEPGTRGIRLEGSVRHVQDLGHGFHDRIDAAFFSDGYYWRDLNTDVLATHMQYIRSTATLYHVDTNSWVGLDAVFRQDIRWGFGLFGDKGAPNTLQRLPGLAYDVPDRQLLGPIWGGMRIEYARLAPIRGLTGDEGPDGVFDPRQGSIWNDPEQSDHLFQAGEREARDRIDFNPHLTASFGSRFARLTPYLAYREDVYLGEINGTFAHRGYAMTGAVAETELSRTFGEFRHSISPSVELRYVPYVFGGVPLSGAGNAPFAYDEVDNAIPGATLNQMEPVASGINYKSLLQGIAQIRQRLAIRRPGGIQQAVQLDIGQGYDFLHQQPADTFARLMVSAGIVTASGVWHYDLFNKRIAQLSTTFAIDDHKGDMVYANFDDLLDTGSDPMRRGIDSLLGPAAPCVLQDPLAPPGSSVPCQIPSRAEQITAGTRFKLGFGLQARYEVIITPNSFGVNPANPTAPAGTFIESLGYAFPQQVVALSYGPACDCWRVEGHAIFHSTTLVPDFGLTLTISRFGTFGS